jgi:uncharacterized membrane protein
VLPLVLLASSYMVSPASAQFLYTVTGVAQNDTLKIRLGIPESDNLRQTRIVGEIPPEASGITGTGVSYRTDGGGLWREIRYNGVTGWVNAAFIARDRSGDWEPAALDCFGTEPFWTLKIDGTQSTLERLDRETTTLERLSMNRAVNRRDIWEMTWQPSNAANAATTVVMERDACSDGMSDFTYDLELLILGLQDGAGPLAGCCAMPPE